MSILPGAKALDLFGFPIDNSPARVIWRRCDYDPFEDTEKICVERYNYLSDTVSQNQLLLIWSGESGAELLCAGRAPLSGV